MGGLVSFLTGDFSGSEDLAQVVIAPLDENGQIDAELGGAKVLQYWPDSVDESDSANWQEKSFPGLNRPIFQWINGGSRQIIFVVKLSRDMDGEIGSEVEEDKHNIDIDAAIAWLHLLKANDYQAVSDMMVAVSPPVLFLSFLGTQMGYNSNVDSALSSEFKKEKTSPDFDNRSTTGVHCILVDVSVQRTNWFPSGRPRNAEVSLTFNESIQIGQNVLAYGRDKLKQLAAKYTRTENGK